MPFRSKAQMRKLYATKPGVARRMAEDTSKQAMARLPERVPSHEELHHALRRRLKRAS